MRKHGARKKRNDRDAGDASQKLRDDIKVTAGLKCAPERLPNGEKTIAIAVLPIAIPINIRRTKGSEIAFRTGDAGYSSRMAKIPAEIMKRHNSIASQTYSGQCPPRPSSLPLIGSVRVGILDAGTPGSSIPATVAFTVVSLQYLV
jgi:hypothetical protein